MPEIDHKAKFNAKLERRADAEKHRQEKIAAFVFTGLLHPQKGPNTDTKYTSPRWVRQYDLGGFLRSNLRKNNYKPVLSNDFAFSPGMTKRARLKQVRKLREKLNAV